jgi:hypothetical protein
MGYFLRRAAIVLPPVRSMAALVVSPDDTPKIDPAPQGEKESLEVSLGNGVKFPLKRARFLHLTTMEPDAKLLLFDFNLAPFAERREAQSCCPMASIP